MVNDSQIKKPVDLTKINTNDIGELLWWSCQLGVNPEKILSIINKVGNSTEKIRKYIIQSNSHQ
jgi:hypothetical protein